MKLAGNRSPNWALLERFEIPDYDDPTLNYLTRWRILQTPWFGLLLHRMDGPDPRRTLHDHPWPFVSFVLRGGYIEDTDAGIRTVTRLNVKRATDLHSIVKLIGPGPTWTFLVTGRRRRVWGYQDASGWTPFNVHMHNDEFNAAMAARKAQP